MERAVSSGVRRVKFKVDFDRLCQFIDSPFVIDKVDVAFDFNGSLNRADLGVLPHLDGTALSFVEEPSTDLGLMEYVGLAESVGKPIFLDESAESRAVINDIAHVDTGLGIVVKPARFGSVLWLHDTLEMLATRGVRCYLGGMFESSIGRRFLLAFGSHRCFTEVGDMAPSSWYYSDDIEPHVVAQVDRYSLNGSFSLGCDVKILENHVCGDQCFSLA
jgi:O-succinylbenzoate synthase